MSMSNASETALLNLLFNNTDWANVGDAAGLQNSATAGSFYVALHTGDPGEAGTQATNEATYTGYARVAVARSGAGWTVTGNQVTSGGVRKWRAHSIPAHSANQRSIRLPLTSETTNRRPHRPPSPGGAARRASK